MWKKRTKTIFLYFILAIPVVWLIVGIVLFLMGNVNVTNWHTIFALRDYPIWSLVLLLVIGLIYWMSANNHWAKVRKWVSGFNSLSRITQATIFTFANFLCQFANHCPLVSSLNRVHFSKRLGVIARCYNSDNCARYSFAD